MGFLIPEREIKQTLANADATLLKVRGDILPRVEGILIRVDAIAADLQAITARLKEIFAPPKL
jgi:hypothetical protein